MGRMHGLVKQLVFLAVTVFTLYLCTRILKYGLLLLMCVILLVTGSLLAVHVEGAAGREALWSMSKAQRQQFHAKNLPLFSIIPLMPENRPLADVAGPREDVPKFRAWNEWQWRKLTKTGDLLANEMLAGREFVREVDNYIVRSGLPSREEVERCGNTIVLSVRGLWAGLAARINPVLNAFLNRFVKCWNRSLVFTTIRLSSYGLPYPAVSIDFPTADVATLNFGQKDDCLVMSYIYDLVRRTYPTSKIVLLSVCLGGLRILNWLSRNPNPENLVGVVLESPLPSVRHLLQGFLGKYAHEDLYNTFALIVPNFRPELEDQYSFFRPLKKRGNELCRVPMFVGMVDDDPFSNPSHLPLFCDRFPNLTVFRTPSDLGGGERTSHGKLYRVTEYRDAVHKFLTAIAIQNHIAPIAPPKSVPLAKAPPESESDSNWHSEQSINGTY